MRNSVVFAARLCALVFFLSLLPHSVACAPKPGAVKSRPERAPREVGNDLRMLDDMVSGLYGLENRLSEYSGDEQNLVSGYAAYRRGRYAEAMKLLERAALKFPAVSDYILFYRAASANRAGKPEVALGLLEKEDSSHKGSVWSKDMKLERARALVSLGRCREARAFLDDYIRMPGQEGPLEAQKLLVMSYIAEKNFVAASGMLRRLAVSADGEGMLKELFGLMAKLKSESGEDLSAWLARPSQQLSLARSFAGASQWDEAVVRLEKLLSGRSLSSQMRAEARWLLARGLRWTDRYDEAISIMEDLIKDPAASGFSQGVMNTLATTYTKRDDYARAIELRKRIMRGAAPGSSRAADMAYRIAFLVMDEGKFEEAIPLWRRALSNRSLRRREKARWYLAWSHYKAGKYSDAVSLFDDMRRSGGKRSNIYDRLSYWRGKALEKQEKMAVAREAFATLVRERPNGYYAELAARSLRGERPNPLEFARIAGASKAGRGKSAELSAAGSNLSRVALFDRLGLHEEAARELRAGGGPGSERVLALARRNFAHDVAYRIAEGRYRSEVRGDPAGGGRRAVWEAAYPRAYDPLVSALSGGSAIDPRFVWSIMRNESAFRPEVVSPAGAIGLMQLMPATAARMAPEAGLRNVARGNLFRPATNIALGITYLKKISGMFPGNPAAWAASYNAGEMAVSRWTRKGRISEIEEWIEDIPYDETNLYVKKVMLSYWRYQRLYGR